MPKIALVRGRYLNRYEMQSYEPLASKYKFTGFGSLTCFHDNFSFPVVKLPSPIDLLGITNEIGIPQRLTLGVLNRLFIDSQYLFGLEEKLKSFDIAHTAETYYHFTHQCLVAKKKGYVKKVVSTVWENIPFNNEGIRGRKGYKKDAIKNVDHFIAVSDKARQALLLEGCSEDKITVISPGIDTKLFKPGKKDVKNSLTILFSGRLEKEKGIYDYMQAAFNLLHEKDLKNINLKFIVVGKGTEKKNIISLSKKLGIGRFIDFQEKNYEDMPEVYQKADILVAPSYKIKSWQEQFSMVLLEAQASGLPIVTTKTGSIEENAKDAALIVPPQDSDEFTKALKRLIVNPKLRLELREKGRKRAVKYFDSSVVSQKIDNIYEKLLA